MGGDLGGRGWVLGIGVAATGGETLFLIFGCGFWFGWGVSVWVVGV